jgi:hypothetical protein
MTERRWKIMTVGVAMGVADIRTKSASTWLAIMLHAYSNQAKKGG